MLRSYESELGVNWFTNAFEGGKDRLDILQLRAAHELVPSRAAHELVPSRALPDRLTPAPELVPTGDDHTPDRTFRPQGNKINGRAMNMSRIDEVVEVGSTEIWEVQNTDGDSHNFHAHDVQFQILDIDGEPPPAEFDGWKDTVVLPPGTTLGSPCDSPITTTPTRHTCSTATGCGTRTAE